MNFRTKIHLMARNEISDQFWAREKLSGKIQYFHAQKRKEKVFRSERFDKLSRSQIKGIFKLTEFLCAVWLDCIRVD
jgi:hypothetical protein